MMNSVCAKAGSHSPSSLAPSVNIHSRPSKSMSPTHCALTVDGVCLPPRVANRMPDVVTLVLQGCLEKWSGVVGRIENLERREEGPECVRELKTGDGLHASEPLTVVLEEAKNTASRLVRGVDDAFSPVPIASKLVSPLEFNCHKR